VVYGYRRTKSGSLEEVLDTNGANGMSRGLGMPRIWQWSEADRRAGLPKPSLVKVGKLVTIDQRWVRQHLGRVPPTTRHNISTMLRRILEA
jgi:hypothetical protein